MFSQQGADTNFEPKSSAYWFLFLVAVPSGMNAAEHKAFLWFIGSLIALSWLTLWVWGRSPFARYLDHGRLGEIDIVGGAASILVPATLYLIGWILMTTAMMLPTTLPLLQIYQRLTAKRPLRT